MLSGCHKALVLDVLKYYIRWRTVGWQDMHRTSDLRSRCCFVVWWVAAVQDVNTQPTGLSCGCATCRELKGSTHQSAASAWPGAGSKANPLQWARTFTHLSCFLLVTC